MCGIFALVANNKTNININDQVLKQFMSIKHRGPDSSTLQRIKNNIVLGFHRLSIIDPDSKSDQPLYTGPANDFHRISFICNGEIYNYQSLIQKYSLKPRTGSDCEVIGLLYEKIGFESTIQELCGEFALVLHDSKTNETFAARDHVGVRRMKYRLSSEGDNKFVTFASERVPGINDMNEFLPGHYVRILQGRDGQIRLDWKAYVDLFAFNVEKSILYTRDMTCQHIRYLLIDAVQSMIRSDVPIGVLLSGGLDSSLLAALIHKIKPHGVKYFSIGLQDSVDLHYAKQVASHLKIPKKDYHVYTFTPQEGIKVIPRVIQVLGTCDITTIRASVPQYLLAERISKRTNVKVVFSGEGSDELFAGYRYSKDAPNAEALWKDACALISEISYFDCLRSDGTLAAHGLEMRAPFLHKPLVEFALKIMPKDFRLYTSKGLGKSILRDAFAACAESADEKKTQIPLLPDVILQRPKEAFSDAVSSKQVSWYKSLQAYVETIISDQDMKNSTAFIDASVDASQHLIPRTKEALYYRQLYEKFWGSVTENTLPRFWMPRFQSETINKTLDPSATILPSF